MEDQYLNKKQLAGLLGCSVAAINSWMRNGILPYIKISPRCVRFDLNQVKEAIGKMVVCETRSDKCGTRP
jgi:predicted site-specific integrase-resolvase